MQEVLKESSEARKFGIALQHVEYSGDLVGKLMQHSTKLESIYGKLQLLTSADCHDNKKFEKFFAILDGMQSWYKQAEAQSSVSHGGFVGRLACLDCLPCRA